MVKNMDGRERERWISIVNTMESYYAPSCTQKPNLIEKIGSSLIIQLVTTNKPF